MKPGHCRSCGRRLGANLRALCATCAFNLPRETAERLRAAAPEVEQESILRADESPLGWRNLLLSIAIRPTNPKKVGHA